LPFNPLQRDSFGLSIRNDQGLEKRSGVISYAIFFPLFPFFLWAPFSFALAKQTQGTYDPGFLDLFLFMDKTKAVFVPQGNDQLGQGLVAEAAAKLAIQSIDGRLPEGIAVNILDGF